MVMIWLLVLIATILLNFIITDFIFLGITIGSLIALILDFLHFSIAFQIVAFGIVAVFITIVFYPKIKKKLKVNKNIVKNLDERYLGMQFILNEPIDGDTLILFKGSYWTFRNKTNPLEKGVLVEIIGIDGIKLIVEKANPFKLEKS
ncbi:MAG: NfeD family protein [Sarcina sp.]